MRIEQGHHRFSVLLYITSGKNVGGIGRDGIWTVSVLVKNAPAVAFWRAMGYTDYALTLEIMPQA